jgi:hypothetical protein
MKETSGVGQLLKGGAEHDTTVQDVDWLQIGSPMPARSSQVSMSAT